MFTFINTILISNYTNDWLFCNTTHATLYRCLDLKDGVFLPNIAFSNILTVPNCSGPNEIQQQQLPILHGQGHPSVSPPPSLACPRCQGSAAQQELGSPAAKTTSSAAPRTLAARSPGFWFCLLII